jgi:hypothetical protein
MITMSTLMVTSSVSLAGVSVESPSSPVATRAPVGSAIEVARRRLRRGYRLEAAELLDRCVRALARDRIDDAALAERRRYAHDRCTGDGRTSLPPDVLQRVIVWVTRDELTAAEQALAADRPFAAARFLIAADRIDPRGTRSAYLHARALYRAAQKSVDRAAVGDRGRVDGPDRTVPAHLKRAERCLRRAASLLLRAAEDPAQRLECDHLSLTIGARLAALTERRVTTDRMAAACACLVDYDAFARHHADRERLSPSAQAGFRSSLAALSGRIDRLLHRCPPASAEARLLHTLADGVAGMQRTSR